MGRKRYRIEQYDAFEERRVIRALPDDRKAASKVKNMRELETLSNRRGAVSEELNNWDSPLVEYGADGTLKVNRDNVKANVEYLTEVVKSTRFYGVREIDRQEQERAAELGVTQKQVRNMDARMYQAKAIATLAAAKVGKVEISAYDKGILNKLAAGQYYEVVFGKESESGKRQFERGTWVSQYGSNRKSAVPKDARAEEKARILREYRFGDDIGRRRAA
jgi:hypothetical protein